MGDRIKYILAIFLAYTTFSCSHDVDFSGLIRSTDRVEERFAQSVQWNSDNSFENITVNADNYRIILASDVHIGGTENFSIVKSKFNSEDFIAFALIGDIVSGKKEDYDILRDSIQDIAKPLFLMIGNHDLYFDGWKTFYDYFGSSTYYFTVQTNSAKDLFICLDSGGGTFGKSQIDWLEDLLKNESQNCRNITILSHVNILRSRRTTSANPLVEEVVYLLDLFARYNVDFVINGHDHLQDEQTFGSTKYLILDALKDGYDNAGYLILNVDSENINYEFVRL